MPALVPTVDLRPWRDGGDGDRRGVAHQLDEACRSIGFLQVTGHGIADATVGRMRAATDAFFALPLEEKLAVVPDHAGINRGYAPMGTEALAYSLGVEPSVTDLFEAFNIGPDVVPDDEWHAAAPHDLFAPNVWPAGVPGLRPALTDYFAAAADVGRTLTDVFALALGLPDGWFRPFVDRSTLTMRVNNYERRPGDPDPATGQMRMGAHTDYGIVTVLYADPVPGLQILAGGAWHDVVPEPGALLVNLGDLTAQWTNDRWRSTLHRVVPPPPDADGRAHRRSVALFLDGNYDAVVECLPTCLADGEAPRYPAVVAGEHLIAKVLGPRTLSASDAIDTAGDRLRAGVTG
jgi:isopenicillin N synthase-like dioxygenase